MVLPSRLRLPRRLGLLSPFLAALLPPAPAPADPAPPAGLPPVLGTHRLHVLSERQPVLVDAGGRLVELAVPVFVYLPEDAPTRETLARAAALLAAPAPGTPDWTRAAGALAAEIARLAPPVAVPVEAAR